MKKIFMFMAAAALCCISFNSCEKDDNPDGTDGTEQTDGTEGEEGTEGEGGNEGEEPAAPEYIADVTTTATSITFTVNSTGEYGYKYAIYSEETYQEASDMNAMGVENPTEEEQNEIMLTALSQGMSDDVYTDSTPITVETESSFMFGLFGGDDIVASTKYYIAVVDVYPDDIIEGEFLFDKENIKFITVTTPAE